MARVLVTSGLSRCPPASLRNPISDSHYASAQSVSVAEEDYEPDRVWSQEDSMTNKDSLPVFRHAPTPRTVSFVEPDNRISGCSSRVWYIPGGDSAQEEGALRSQPEVFGSHIHSTEHAEPGEIDQASETCSASQADTASARTVSNSVHDTSATVREPVNAAPKIGPSATPAQSLARPTSAPPAPCGGQRGHRALILRFSSLRDRLWTPLCLLTVIYLLLIVGWGAAVFILIMGWTPMPVMDRFRWIEICSQVRPQN